MNRKRVAILISLFFLPLQFAHAQTSTPVPTVDTGRDGTTTPAPTNPLPTPTNTPTCDQDGTCPPTPTTTATPTPTPTPWPYHACGHTWEFDNEDDLFIWADDSPHVSWEPGYMRIEGGAGLGVLAYYDELLGYVDLPAIVNGVEVYIDVASQSQASISIVALNATDYQDGHIPPGQDVQWTVSGHAVDAQLLDVGFSVGNNTLLLVDSIQIRIPCANVIPDTPTPSPTPTITPTATLTEPTSIFLTLPSGAGHSHIPTTDRGQVLIVGAVAFLGVLQLGVLLFGGDLLGRLRLRPRRVGSDGTG